MAIQAISREPLPVGNQLEIIHKWEINGDARVVRLIQAGADRLMCQVFNRATNECTHRFIQLSSSNEFASLSAFAGYISANMRPVLGSNRQGSTCTAMLVQHSYQFVHAWYAGSNGDVEVKLFHKPDFLKGICIALDTSSNKQKVFSLNKDIRAENARLYEPLITYDVDGFLNTLDFQIIHQIAPAPLLQPALRLPPPVESVIQSASVQAASIGEVGDLPPWDSQAWAVVREWDLGNGKKVRLCRFGDNFCSKYAHSGDFTQAKVTQMPIPPDMSADEVFAEISTMQPFINPDASVKYLIAEKSRLNDGVMIDEENWGVTLIDTGSSECDVPTTIGIGKCQGNFKGKKNSPYSWGGHAVIVIEQIDDDGRYHVLRSDILFGERGQIEPRLFEEFRLERFDGNFSRSKTWIREKSLVKRMIEEIKGHIELYERGDSVGKFNALIPAKEPLALKMFKTLRPAKKPLRDEMYNCIEWCKKQMSVACINVPSSSSSLFLSTPMAAMSSTRGTVQEVVTQVAVSGAWGIGGAIGWGAIGFLLGGPPGSAIGAWVGGIGGASSSLLCSNLHNDLVSKDKYAQQKI